VQKLGYLLVAGMISRTKFHGVWKLSGSAALISGVGVGSDSKGTIHFHAFENISIFELETCENVKASMDSWNKVTARWLRRYVYDRVSSPVLKNRINNALLIYSISD
jgi:lysophospholipid acyltransferase